MGRRPGLDNERTVAPIVEPGWWAEREGWLIAVYVMAGALLGLAVGTGCDLTPGVPESLSLTFRLLVTTAVWTGPGLVGVPVDGQVSIVTNGE